MRTIRLFSILDYLRGKRHPVTAETLAEEHEVSVRTIYRDMGVLIDMGAPIRGEGGIGYQLEKGYFLPPLHFDYDEMDALVLGMRMIAARGDEDLSEAAVRVLGKINAVVSGDDLDKGERALLAVSVEEDSSQIPFLSVLRLAIRDKEKLDLSYCDLKGNSSERIVRPLGLTVFDQVWLLTGWCENKEDFRNFRVDRLESVKTVGLKFAVEAGKEFRDYLATL